MSDRERPTDRRPNHRAAIDPRQRSAPAHEATHRAPRTITQPLSARAAAAQFDLAAVLQSPPEAPRDRALIPPGQRVSTELTTRPTDPEKAEMPRPPAADSGRDAGRLPSTWYKKADEIAEASRKERMALLIRGAAAVCLATGAALLFWLGAFGGRAMTELPKQTLASRTTTTYSLPMASLVPPDRPEATAVNPSARALVTTAQILAVAERFVATGDILAARAMLSDTAATGDGSALFALAETYDPNLLASWSANDIEASPTYARLLYQAALKAGVADAQTRLDALK